jgi:hypothetical protein
LVPLIDRIKAPHGCAERERLSAKRDRAAIRHFIARYVEHEVNPISISQDDVLALYKRLVADGAAESAVRQEFNTFIAAFNRQDPHFAFTKIPGPRDASADANAAFHRTFGGELDALFAESRMAMASRNQLINGLKNAVSALAVQGVHVNSLHELLVEDNVMTVRETFDPSVGINKGKKGGTNQQVLSALSFLARKHEDFDLHAKLAEASTKARSGKTLPVERIESIIPYLGTRSDPFRHLVGSLLQITLEAENLDITMIRKAHRISAALCGLLAIFLPAYFDKLVEIEFGGPPESTGDRPTLVRRASRKSGKVVDKKVEQRLNGGLRLAIDRFYAAYRRAGVAPVGLMPTPLGAQRTHDLARASIDAVLKEVGVPFTFRTLATIGVAQALFHGDSPEVVARALGQPLDKFKGYHQPLIDQIVKEKATS